MFSVNLIWSERPSVMAPSSTCSASSRRVAFPFFCSICPAKTHASVEKRKEQKRQDMTRTAKPQPRLLRGPAKDISLNSFMIYASAVLEGEKTERVPRDGRSLSIPQPDSL